jgi:hypothetical protein
METEELGERVLAALQASHPGEEPTSIAELARDLCVSPKAVIAAVRDHPKMNLDGDDEKPDECWVFVEE